MKYLVLALLSIHCASTTRSIGDDWTVETKEGMARIIDKDTGKVSGWVGPIENVDNAVDLVCATLVDRECTEDMKQVVWFEHMVNK